MSLQSFINSHMYKQKQSANLIRIGFDFDKPVEYEFYRVQRMLFDLYHIQGESMLSIMKLFSIPSLRTMSILFQHFEIESKSLSEAGYDAFANDRRNVPDGYSVYVCSTHTSWEGKRFFLRSSYEINYAKKLDDEQIPYEVESMRLRYFDTQLNRFRIAIPDFYLPTTNTIIEVKSNYYLDRQNMIDKFTAYRSLGFHPSLLLEGEITDL